jgi:hypothetical protein
MRYLLALVVVAAGCVATLPSDHGVSADLAAETARMVVQMRHEPAPTPAPPKPVVPAGKCPKCLGTGKLSTDGRIVIPCSACNGTGKACSDGRCQ